MGLRNLFVHILCFLFLLCLHHSSKLRQGGKDKIWWQKINFVACFLSFFHITVLWLRFQKR